MKEFIQEQVEIVESEFPKMDYEELFEIVWNAIIRKGAEKYNSMIEVDKFDYLVDTIIENIIENEVSRLEKQTNAECR